jgi:Ca2+-binding EF-hand superfamily protein
MEKRNYEKQVDIDRVPEMMQAIGFYPTEQEIECMVNEIKYQNVIETGVPKTKISFEDWVKLYVNYRPCQALTVEDIVDALKDLNAIDSSNQVSMEKLTTALGEFGEVFPPQEFKEILRNLTENHPKLRQNIDEQVSLEDFLSGILGFLPLGSAETA